LIIDFSYGLHRLVQLIDIGQWCYGGSLLLVLSLGYGNQPIDGLGGILDQLLLFVLFSCFLESLQLIQLIKLGSKWSKVLHSWLVQECVQSLGGVLQQLFLLDVFIGLDVFLFTQLSFELFEVGDFLLGVLLLL
jgi:hypothetical protein